MKKTLTVFLKITIEYLLPLKEVTMTVKDIIDTPIINTTYKIVSHWNRVNGKDIEYLLDDEIATRKVEAILVIDNTLIISI
jgi:hypothetical protein